MLRFKPLIDPFPPPLRWQPCQLQLSAKLALCQPSGSHSHTVAYLLARSADCCASAAACALWSSASLALCCLFLPHPNASGLQPLALDATLFSCPFLFWALSRALFLSSYPLPRCVTFLFCSCSLNTSSAPACEHTQ